MNHITLIPNNIQVFADTADTVGDLINQIRRGQTGGEDVEILEENENGDKKVIPADVKVSAGRMTR